MYIYVRGFFLSLSLFPTVVAMCPSGERVPRSPVTAKRCIYEGWIYVGVGWVLRM